MKRHYYALYDWFQARSNQPGFGFANSKRAIVFDSRKKRDEFVKKTSEHDYSCRAITRKEALKHLETHPFYEGKGLLLNRIDGENFFILKGVGY